MIVARGEHTSYSVVMSPPGVDRIFLHCTGANDTFCTEDIDYAALASARLFHFGYPPLMRRMYEDGGVQLAALLARAKAAGPTISLDMAFVDPASPAGRADWPGILAKALPHVDVFVPSLDETLFMLDRARFARLQEAAGTENVLSHVNGRLLAELSDRLLSIGPAIIMLKLGDQGTYLRTTGDPQRLAAAGPCGPCDMKNWLGRELLAPCFSVEVVGTTGSGDCTIAGFLTALLHGLSAEGAMTAAVGVGACNVEAADATSGIPHWDRVQARIAAGWKRRPVRLELPGWRHDAQSGLYLGPNDKSRS
jgi:sugar/nucleoside kinase (ribokinase family)